MKSMRKRKKKPISSAKASNASERYLAENAVKGIVLNEPFIVAPPRRDLPLPLQAAQVFGQGALSCWGTACPTMMPKQL